MLLHVFQLGMVNTSVGLGGYASAPTAFGPWSFQEAAAVYDGDMRLSDGSRLVLGRRERPHLLLDAQQRPAYLYNGVCPAGRGSLDIAGILANESGHCFTAVQKIAA